MSLVFLVTKHLVQYAHMDSAIIEIRCPFMSTLPPCDSLSSPFASLLGSALIILMALLHDIFQSLTPELSVPFSRMCDTACAGGRCFLKINSSGTRSELGHSQSMWNNVCSEHPHEHSELPIPIRALLALVRIEPVQSFHE